MAVQPELTVGLPLILKRNNNMNAQFFSIILMSLIFSTCNAQSQELTPLFEIEDSYLENGYLIVPKFQIKTDNKSILYHKGKVCFVPSENFSLCIYEVFSDKYIIISPIKEKNKFSSEIYICFLKMRLRYIV